MNSSNQPCLVERYGYIDLQSLVDVNMYETKENLQAQKDFPRLCHSNNHGTA